MKYLPRRIHANPAASFDPGTAGRVLDELERLLADGNIEAGNRVKDAAGILAITLGGAAVILKDQVAAFDFESALRTLRQGRLNPPPESTISEYDT